MRCMMIQNEFGERAAQARDGVTATQCPVIQLFCQWQAGKEKFTKIIVNIEDNRNVIYPPKKTANDTVEGIRTGPYNIRFFSLPALIQPSFREA